METRTKKAGPPSNECELFQEILERAVCQLPVSPEENEFDREHRRQCMECASFARFLAALEEIPALPALPDEELVEIKREVIARREAGRRRARRTAAVSLAAGVAALLTLASLLATREAPPDGLELKLLSGTLAPAEGGNLVAPGSSVEEGDEVLAGDAGAVLIAGELIRLHLVRGTRMRIGAARGKRLLIRLGPGAVAVEAKIAANESLEAETPHCRIAVEGTVFFVEVTQKDTRVDVLAGLVRVESAGWERPVSVEAGMSFTAGDRQKKALPGRRKEMILSLLGRREAPSPPEGESEPEGALEGAGADSEEPRAKERGPAGRSSRPGAGGARPAPPARHPVAGVRREPVKDERRTVRQMIEEARDCRTRMQWRCAVEAYTGLIELHPDSPEAVTVRVPLAEIELEHLGRPDKAMVHYDRYLEERPEGSMVQEALYGKARALAALGRLDEEKKVIRTFLERYPSSLYAPRMRNRLLKLKEGAADEH